MTDAELNQKRDELALNFSSFEPGEELNGLNLVARDQLIGFKAGFDSAVQLLRETPSAHDNSFLRVSAENERLRGEVDALKEDWQHLSATIDERDQLREENTRLREALSHLPKVPTEPYEKQMAKRIVGLEAETENLSTKLQRTVNAAYHALLEMSAWMGIPEKNRHAQIEHLMGNVKYCAEHDLRHIDEHNAVTALKAELVQAKIEASKDYEGMRDMQRKLIAADHERISWREMAESLQIENAELRKRLSEI